MQQHPPRQRLSSNAAVCFILQFRLGHGTDTLDDIGLVQDGALILGGEAPPAWPCDHFGIRNRRTRAWRRGARLAYADQCEISFPALQ